MARFNCQSCGKSYRWKPELAGRKVKCTCGHVMLAPRQMGEPEDDLIPLAEDQPAAHTVHGHQVMAATVAGSPAVRATPAPKPRGASKNGRCPKCNAELPAGAVLCVECGMHLEKGAPVSGAAAPPKRVVHVNRGQLLGAHVHKEEAPKRDMKKVYLLAAIVAALAVVAFMLMRGGE